MIDLIPPQYEPDVEFVFILMIAIFLAFVFWVFHRGEQYGLRRADRAYREAIKKIEAEGISARDKTLIETMGLAKESNILSRTTMSDISKVQSQIGDVAEKISRAGGKIATDNAAMMIAIATTANKVEQSRSKISEHLAMLSNYLEKDANDQHQQVEDMASKLGDLLSMLMTPLKDLNEQMKIIAEQGGSLTGIADIIRGVENRVTAQIQISKEALSLRAAQVVLEEQAKARKKKGKKK